MHETNLNSPLCPPNPHPSKVGAFIYRLLSIIRQFFWLKQYYISWWFENPGKPHTTRTRRAENILNPDMRKTGSSRILKNKILDFIPLSFLCVKNLKFGFRDQILNTSLKSRRLKIGHLPNVQFAGSYCINQMVNLSLVIKHKMLERCKNK